MALQIQVMMVAVMRKITRSVIQKDRYLEKWKTTITKTTINMKSTVVTIYIKKEYGIFTMTRSMI